MFDSGTLITAALSPEAASLRSAAAKYGTDVIHRLRAAYTDVFVEHVRTTHQRVSHVKTLVYRNRPVDLKSQYVSVDLNQDGSDLSDEELFSSLFEHHHYIVSGTAGAGKSMLMKFISLSLLERPPSRTLPIYLELRHFSNTGENAFENFMAEQTSSSKGKVSLDLLRVGLEEGVFTLILDGLDELPLSNREAALPELLKLPLTYPKTTIILSTRPDPQSESALHFSTYRIKPMSRDKIIEVVTRIEFHDAVKGRFIQRLKDGLYKSHQSFLSNPLLATMMLLTFDQFADIPDRMIVFYEQAFETLYLKHDLTKDGYYNREHYAGLSMDIFRKTLSTFCYMTITKNKTEFTVSEILSNLRKSIEYDRIEADPSDLAKDLELSTCLLQRDGLHLTFVHRSFQEYFSAVFAASYRGDNVLEVISALGRLNPSNALKMLYEIDAYYVEKYWALPMLESIWEAVGDIDPSKETSRFVACIYSGLHGALPEARLTGRSWSGRHLAADLHALTTIYRSLSSLPMTVLGLVNAFPPNFESFESFVAAFERQHPELRTLLAKATESSSVGSIRIEFSESSHDWLNLTPMADEAAVFKEALHNLLNQVRKSVADRPPVNVLLM